MMSFKELNLKQIYDIKDDIFNSLFNPLLKSAVSYKRGVGYFTSSWLEICSEGLIDIANRSGKITLVTSPHLDEKDWQAFRIGSKAQQDETIYNSLKRQVDDLQNSTSKSKLVLLSWLIADGLLDIKIVVPKNGKGNFHDKFAVFEDENGDKVALHGSLNDSEQASYNGEGVTVFCSWLEGQEVYVKGHEDRFNEFFLEESDYYNIYKLPNAIKLEIANLRRNNNRPYKRPVNQGVQFSIPEHIELYDFQEEAINNWFKNDNQGLFEMATGTGKTITSLAAATRMVNQVGYNVSTVLISVPFNHLVDQWADEVKEFGYSPVLCYGNSSKWRPIIKSKILDINKGLRKNLCIITTHNTGSSDNFLKLINKINSPILYIADESHYLGSKQYSKLLHDRFDYRIGLSATPDRWFDERGSEKLRDYFNVTVTDLSITGAIKKGFLTPYRFFPNLVNLTDEEYEKYSQLTSKISKLQNNTALSAREKNERIKNNLIKRASVINNAENKIELFKEKLEQKIEKEGLENISHTLVYCSPGKTQEIVRLLADKGLKAHEFVYKVSNKQRIELLKQFENGDIQVLVAIKCLDEGVNIPATREAYFLSSTTNPREFVQRRGRILRKYKGKKEAIIHDFYVTPPLDADHDSGPEGLIKREMPRFAEFADGALNEFEARNSMLPLLDKYNLRHIIDLKPWDAYKQYNLEGSEL